MPFRKVVSYDGKKGSIIGIEDNMNVYQFKGATYLVPARLIHTRDASNVVAYRVIRKSHSFNEAIATDVRNTNLLEKLAEIQAYWNYQRNMQGVKRRHQFGKVTIEILAS